MYLKKLLIDLDGALNIYNKKRQSTSVNLINLTFNALDILYNIKKEGLFFPLSSFPTYVGCIPTFSAKSSCVNFASFLANFNFLPNLLRTFVFIIDNIDCDAYYLYRQIRFFIAISIVNKEFYSNFK